MMVAMDVLCASSNTAFNDYTYAVIHEGFLTYIASHAIINDQVSKVHRRLREDVKEDVREDMREDFETRPSIIA